MLSSHPTTAEVALEGVLQVISPDGERHASPELDPWLTDVSPRLLRAMHRDMLATRRIDREGVALQRQGELGLWAPAEGQEGVQIGTAHALRADDFVFPSYREHGVVFVRGAKLIDFISMWRGEEHSSYNPYEINTAGQQIIIGAQALHAVGYAMGIQRDALTAPVGARIDQVSVAYFGDGASSQGDVHEAMVFASSFAAPVVFVCTNNQWAISEPVAVQAKYPIAGRAAGYGIPTVRVDGNDALACFAVMSEALYRARSGGGPSFIEAVSYRMGPHTTADDPTRYRSSEEVDAWRQRDPIARLETYLRSIGELSDAQAEESAASADRIGAELRAVCLASTTKPALDVFANVFDAPHAGLERQRAHYKAYLDGFESAVPDKDAEQ